MKILITGGTRGIWRELVRKFLQNWDEVLCLARNIDNFYIDEFKGKLLKYSCDIWKIEEHEKLMQFLEENNFVPNILINNVWIWYSEDFLNFPYQKIKEIFATNLIGTIVLTQNILKFADKNIKHIAFVSSLAGKIWFEGLSIYSASKFWIEGFVNSLRQELKHKVFITLIRPGIVATDFFRYAQMKIYQDEKMMEKFQTPEYVASEIFKAIENKKEEITIWKDKYFLFFRRFIPQKWEHPFLKFFTL